MSKFFNSLKTVFFVLFMLQFLPTMFSSFKKQYSDLMQAKTKIGVIPIKSSLYDSDKYIKNLKEYFKDNSIKAIILKIDCPGGAAGTSQALFNEIKKLKKSHCKYVIAFVENMAASGGYYIASAADYIISTPSAFIGSIGSYIAYPMFKDFIEQFKVKYEVVKSGDYKTVANPLLETTQAQKDMLQALSDNVYNQFVADIAKQRVNLPKDNKIWADGKIFTGEQALHLGLIDQIGSQSDIKQILEEKASVSGELQLITAKKKTSFLNMLLNPEEDNDISLLSQIASQVLSLFKKDSVSAKY